MAWLFTKEEAILTLITQQVRLLQQQCGPRRCQPRQTQTAGTRVNDRTAELSQHVLNTPRKCVH